MIFRNCSNWTIMTFTKIRMYVFSGNNYMSALHQYLTPLEVCTANGIIYLRHISLSLLIGKLLTHLIGLQPISLSITLFLFEWMCHLAQIASFFPLYSTFFHLYHSLQHRLTTLCSILEQAVKVLKHQWAYSCEKAKVELDYNPRSLKDGLAEMLPWLKNLGLIKF